MNTRDAHTILMKPFVSEKGYDAQAQKGKYQFEVLKNATKVEIRNAVEKLFKVHVVSINVMNQHGKRRRLRAREGFTGDWKKAIVTLKTGEHIDFFERV